MMLFTLSRNSQLRHTSWNFCHILTEVVRVMEGKIYDKRPEGKRKRFELSRIGVTKSKIAVNE